MKLRLSLIIASLLLITFPKLIFARTPSPFSVLQKDFLVQTSSGKNLEENVTIRNTTETREKIQVSWVGYNLSSNDIVSADYLTKHSIDFSSIPQNEIELEPFATESFIVNFAVLDTLKSGDYYGQLMLNNSSYKENVNFTVRILGELQEKIVVESLTDDGTSLKITLSNQGNRTTSVNLKSQISNLVSKEVTLQYNLNLMSGERKTVTQFHKKLLPGFYQTQVGTTFGEKQTTETRIFSFWVRAEFFIFSLVTLIATFVIYLTVRKTYNTNV